MLLLLFLPTDSGEIIVAEPGTCSIGWQAVNTVAFGMAELAIEYEVTDAEID